MSSQQDMFVAQTHGDTAAEHAELQYRDIPALQTRLCPLQDPCTHQAVLVPALVETTAADLSSDVEGIGSRMCLQNITNELDTDYSSATAHATK